MLARIKGLHFITQFIHIFFKFLEVKLVYMPYIRIYEGSIMYRVNW